MSAVIVNTAQARLIVRSSVARPLSVILRYDDRDPLAVRLAFPADASLDGLEVEWTFARELLDTGLQTPAGAGDVRLWPCGPAHTMLELHAAEGMALVELRSADLRGFLHRAHESVPRGHERPATDLDSALTALLRGV
ncbi:SsgA family sporulation/cell division regulator [Streptomyces sp. N2-109]|uniref:SsgA family sporulation/cell division regulator n=1 Tax=Streptomyces gossypii TaxID=2883101 RepID=A0ABT2JYS3_9ACTN|nr:SsgA family sporulation/cell division regulator [Streptomyces gossypii]MCT2593052.1 SsgA family sporulation/cell division regulator [Streptomyces gossypii]